MQVHISRVLFPLRSSIILSSRVSFIPNNRQIVNQIIVVTCLVHLHKRFGTKILTIYMYNYQKKKRKKFIKSKKLEIVNWTIDSRDYFCLEKVRSFETKRIILAWLPVNRGESFIFVSFLYDIVSKYIQYIKLCIIPCCKKLWEDLRRWTVLLVLWIFDPLFDRRWNPIGCIVQYHLDRISVSHLSLFLSIEIVPQHKLRRVLENSFSISVYDRCMIEERIGMIFVNLLFFF